MTDVVIIGDVHGNARALKAVMEQARRRPFDHMIFVGDLLTYGHDVAEVLDLVEEAQTRGATLLVGNHDQMYFDLARGERSYFDKLPDWIKDSVEKTLATLDVASFERRFQWRSEIVIDGVLIAHAGPFGAGDWTYINALEQHQRAAATLAERGLRGGVFGHTHRARWFTGDETGATTDAPVDETLTAPAASVVVANAGSVGQPRDQRGWCVFPRLSIESTTITGSFERVEYDVAEHLRSIRAAGLPAGTTDRLCAFFKNAS